MFGFGIYANSYENSCIVAVPVNDLDGSIQIHSNQNSNFNYAASGIIKKEYRKIRGTNVEEDEDEKNNLIKKTKSPRLQVSKFNGNLPFLHESPQDIAALNYFSTIPLQLFCFPYLTNEKLYSLFQVFRI